jgi:hypothetical protein
MFTIREVRTEREPSRPPGVPHRYPVQDQPRPGRAEESIPFPPSPPLARGCPFCPDLIWRRHPDVRGWQPPPVRGERDVPKPLPYADAPRIHGDHARSRNRPVSASGASPTPYPARQKLIPVSRLCEHQLELPPLGRCEHRPPAPAGHRDTEPTFLAASTSPPLAVSRRPRAPLLGPIWWSESAAPAVPL